MRRSRGTRFAVLVGFLWLFQSARAASPTQDPARFTLVTNWYASFTRSLAGSGNGDYKSGDYSCSASWQYSQNQSVKGQLGGPPEFLGFNQWIFYWTETDSTTLDIGDSYQDTCTDSHDHAYHDSVTAHGNQFLPIDTSVNLTIDTKNKNYVLFFGITMLTTNDYVLLDTPQPNDSSTVPWCIPEAVTNALPESGMVLQGQQTFPLASGFGWEMTPITKFFCYGCNYLDFSQLNGSVQVTWSLSPELEDLEVIVEPKGYDKWIPQGNLKAATERGNAIILSAKLQKKGGGTPAMGADSIEFDLGNVSHEPGVCLNYPQPDQASQDPDLQFESDLNPAIPLAQVSVNQSQVQFTKTDNGGLNPGLFQATATLSCFDFGAYGELTVTAKVPGHDPIKGHLSGKQTTTIPIPNAQAGSHIASAWFKKAKASGADDDDQDDKPQGDGHQGDGLTVYEEYRGFSVNHSHLRTKPGKKDLFIRNGSQRKSFQKGMSQFETASELDVHSRIDKDEVGPDALINFNHDWAHKVDQHALIVVGASESQGYSEAVGRPGFEDSNGTPGTRSQIEIDVSEEGLNFSGGHNGDVFKSYAISDIAHELGHGCSVWHHGDCDVEKVTWSQLTDGSFSETRSSGGKLPIAIFTPDLTPTVPDFEEGTSTEAKYWLAVPQGQHSGDPACIMCYDIADCFMRDRSPNRYVVEDWPEYNQDHFCTSATGQGVNASGIPGGPWLGNASSKSEQSARGNCAGQICVNDLYTNDSKHNRDYDCPSW